MENRQKWWQPKKCVYALCYVVAFVKNGYLPINNVTLYVFLFSTMLNFFFDLRYLLRSPFFVFFLFFFKTLLLYKIRGIKIWLFRILFTFTRTCAEVFPQEFFSVWFYMVCVCVFFFFLFLFHSFSFCALTSSESVQLVAVVGFFFFTYFWNVHVFRLSK